MKLLIVNGNNGQHRVDSTVETKHHALAPPLCIPLCDIQIFLNRASLHIYIRSEATLLILFVFVCFVHEQISKGSSKTRVPDGSPTRSTGGDVNNNGPTKCMNGACGGYGPSSAGGGGGAGDSPAVQPRRVQVTAKILFGSVNAISTMKQNDKLHRKKSQ